MNHIVIISPDSIGSKMAGPGIRYWNLSKTLSKYFQVTLFTPNKCDMKASFRVVQIEKWVLKQSLSQAQAILLQGMTLWKFPFLKKMKVPIIIDLYDPFILENLETFQNSKEELDLHKASLSILIDQLLYGDYFICASEKQKDFWIGMLAAINRVNPLEYKQSKNLSSLIGVVPFGIDDEVNVPQSGRVMKGVISGINENDKVLLWGGGIWPWLDPVTAVKAVNMLAKKQPSIRLFFMGIKPPNQTSATLNKKTREVIDLSDRLGLTNKYVFFNDWVEYENRYCYYLEADVGLSLHLNHLETRFAFRTRMLDYIKCELPIICTEGDIFSELVSKYLIGSVVPAEDPTALADAIEKKLLYNVSKDAFKELQKVYSWENCVQDLVAFCSDPIISSGKQQTFKIVYFKKWKYNIIKLKYYSRELGILKVFKLIFTKKTKELASK